VTKFTKEPGNLISIRRTQICKSSRTTSKDEMN